MYDSKLIDNNYFLMNHIHNLTVVSRLGFYGTIMEHVRISIIIMPSRRFLTWRPIAVPILVTVDILINLLAEHCEIAINVPILFDHKIYQ